MVSSTRASNQEAVPEPLQLGTSPYALRRSLEELKVVALARGLRIGAGLLDDLGGAKSLTVHEYATTGGITLELPAGVLVNAPFDEPFCRDSPLLLDRDDDGIRLTLDGGASAPVTSILPLPGYLGATDGEGRPVDDVAMSHADRLRVSPIHGCAYDCRFCDFAGAPYRQRSADQVIAAIDVAMADSVLPVRHMLISGGSPPASNRAAQEYFEDICRRVREHMARTTASRGQGAFEVDVMMSARPDGPAFVERMVRAGIAGFSFNVELFSEAAGRRHIPLKQKWASRHLEASITRAVELLGWGKGRVRSLIVPGLEAPEDTLAGVEWLASLGCSPILSPFRPARGTALVGADPPSPNELADILREARAIAAGHGVLLGPRCVPCQHNVLAFPWDAECPSER